MIGCAGPAVPSAPSRGPEGVRFTLHHPTARSIAVAGSFNGWSPAAQRMVRDGSGLWTVTVRLPPGEHAFMYVVDGVRWLTPPAADEYVEDGFGQTNGVVIVP